MELASRWASNALYNKKTLNKDRPVPNNPPIKSPNCPQRSASIGTCVENSGPFHENRTTQEMMLTKKTMQIHISYERNNFDDL